MREFRALVDNDYRRGFHFRYIKNSEWKSFSLLVLLLGIGLYISTPVAEVLNIVLIIITNIFNPVLMMGIPYLFTKQVINHEWQNNTVGWWLSLPYSRTVLLASKCTVGFFRFLKILVVIVPIILFLTLITSTMQPGASNTRSLFDLPQRILDNSTIGIILSPLSLALSGLISVLEKSRIKKVLRFIPAAIFLVVLFLNNGNLFPVHFLNFIFFPTWWSSFIMLGFSLGLAVLLFFVAVYVLEHRIDI